jgi:MarR family 2-MHQ and catechol resistance regulon transcriptional repressor
MSIYREMGFKPEKENTSEAALYNVVRTFTLLNRLFQRHYAQFDLTPAKLNVLMLVKHVGGEEGLPQREIAKRLIISGSDVTGLIDRLEKEGLLTRRGASSDRRVKLIKITPKGSVLLDKLWPVHIEQVERVMSPLSKREQEQLIALLTKVRAKLQNGDGTEASYQ